MQFAFLQAIVLIVALIPSAFGQASSKLLSAEALVRVSAPIEI